MYRNRDSYEYAKGLAIGEKLEILAMDPVFNVLESLLPPYGEKTRPSVTSAKGMLLFGVATVLFGGDRAAEREVRYAWNLLRPVLAMAGIPTGEAPPTSQNWQDWRSTYLSAELLDQLRDAAADMYVGAAQSMGLLVDQPDEGSFLRVPRANTVYGDATWAERASNVGVNGKASRSKTGQPRLSEDADTYGYYHTFLAVRRPEERMRLVLWIARTDPGDELAAALRGLDRIRQVAGDGCRMFVYDRALQKPEHICEVASWGVLPMAKPAGVDAFHDFAEVKGSLQKAGMLEFSMLLDGCEHTIGMNVGMMWDLVPTNDGVVYGDWVRHRDVRRELRPDGTYLFVIDAELPCQRGPHRFSVTLNEPFQVPGRSNSVALAYYLRPIPVGQYKLMTAAVGIRSDIESTFNHLKNQSGQGGRARSFSALAHEFDLFMWMLVHNAVVLAEWRQAHEGMFRKAA